MPEPNADREPELLTIAEPAVVLRAPVATLATQGRPGDCVLAALLRIQRG
jgi:hypothetical protein